MHHANTGLCCLAQGYQIVRDQLRMVSDGCAGTVGPFRNAGWSRPTLMLLHAACPEIAAMPGVLAVKADTLAAAALATPGLHLWCVSAQPWVGIDRSLPCFDHAATE